MRIVPTTPDEQRALGLIMLLQHEYPEVGAHLLAVFRGEFVPYVPGWNFVPARWKGACDKWVWIGEAEGRTTFSQPPVSQEEVHTVDPVLPRLQDSSAWRDLLALRERVSFPNLEQLIDAVAQADALAKPEDDQAIGASVDGSKKLLAAYGAPADTLAPFVTREILRPYMELMHCGGVAKYVLGHWLFEAAQGRARGGATVEPHMAVRRSLCDAAAELIAVRCEFGPAMSLYMTYLAVIYIRTAQMLSAWIKATGRATEADVSELRGSDINIEEMAAHEALPLLLLESLPGVERFLLMSHRVPDGWYERQSAARCCKGPGDRERAAQPREPVPSCA